jgi:hypothetical protein
MYTAGKTFGTAMFGGKLGRVIKEEKVKVKQSRYRPGVAHRVPGS